MPIYKFIQFYKIKFNTANDLFKNNLYVIVPSKNTMTSLYSTCNFMTYDETLLQIGF